MKRGFSILEIVISAAVITFTVATVMGVLDVYVNISLNNSKKTQAAILTEEAGEAMQIFRDLGWATKITPLTNGTAYHLIWNGSSYEATTTPTLIHDKFYRTIKLSAVARNSSDDIVTSGGTTDPNTKKVTVDIYANSLTGDPLLETEMLILNTYGS